MYFSSFSELINMNGHGFYVWLAFGVSVFLLGCLLIKPMLNRNDILKNIRSQIELEQNRKEKQ